MLTTKQNLKQIKKKKIKRISIPLQKNHQTQREQERKKETKDDKAPENNFKMAIENAYLPIFTLNLNRQILHKRHRVAKWINKIRPNYMLSQETHFSFKYTQRLNVQGRKIIFHAKGKH